MRDQFDRRSFLKTIGAAGIGSILAGLKLNAAEPNKPAGEQKPRIPQLPKRKLGKTGVEVPCLALGTNKTDNQIILRAAHKHGVIYWDTASSYLNGISEEQIGKFIDKNPELRKELFIATKASRAESMDKLLANSLKRMSTDYIDLYHLHGPADPTKLNDELKQWVENAKKRRAIHFFGLSTHKNMAQILNAASKLGWIDVVMTSYNFRLMQNPELQNAIDACHKAGIGIVAMKVVALSIEQRKQMKAGQQIETTEEDKKVIGYFMQRGLTAEQARIKAVLQDERISCACVGADSAEILAANAAAVLGEAKLTKTDFDVLKNYAKATCSSYCAGCANICDEAVAEMPYTSDIIRFLMYHNSYGDKKRAKELFLQIPPAVRNRLLRINYSTAEARCPQKLPIGKFIAEAVAKLA
jgi:aryl-alcohol dehydrogenase-like predicted oxidoreductase